MGFFSTKGNECWICRRTTTKEGQFLSNTELQSIFEDVFEEFDASELKNHCLCQVCAAILKYTAQDSVAAKIKIGQAQDKVKQKFGSAAKSLREKFGKNNTDEEE